MSETTTTTEKKEGTGQIVSKGQIQSFKPNISLPDNGAQQNNGSGEGEAATETPEQIAAKAKLGEGAAATETPEEIAAKAKLAETAAATTPTTTPKPLTDEEIKAEYEKRFPTTAQPTEIEIKAKADAFEKRMLDLFVEEGLKNPEKKAEDLINQYAALKAIAGGDITELSKAELTRELKAAGFDADQIVEIQKERYYQLEQAEIDAIDDPAEKALAQKKLDYGKAKLEGKATHQKQAAEQFFNTLKSAVTEKDLQATKESEFVSNIEAHFKELPRKLSLELGKLDETTVIDPVDYEVPETAIEEAKSVLKDPVLRKQFLYNSDGSLNLANLSETILKAKMFDSAAKTAYLTGGHREVEKFEKIFPKNPNALGVGGNNSDPKKGTGKIVSVGQPQRFKQAAN